MLYEPQERKIFVIFRRGSDWLRSNRDFRDFLTERVSAPFFFDLPLDQLDEGLSTCPGNYTERAIIWGTVFSLSVNQFVDISLCWEPVQNFRLCCSYLFIFLSSLWSWVKRKTRYRVSFIIGSFDTLVMLCDRPTHYCSMFGDRGVFLLLGVVTALWVSGL